MLLCTNAAAMYVPELFRQAIDAIRAHEHASSLLRLAWQMVGIAVLGAAFRTVSRVAILFAARDAELSLRAAFYRSLTQLDSSFFAEHPTGDLMSRATNDLTQVRLMLGPGLLNVVNTLIAYATAVPLMLRIDAKLTLIAFVVYPPALWWMRRLGKALYGKNRAQQEALGVLANVVQENLAAAGMVRAYAIEDEQMVRFTARNDTFLQANLRLAWLRSGMFRLSASLSGVGILAVALFGAQHVAKQRLSLGDVVALVEYMALLSGPTFALGWVLSLWQRGIASLSRLEDVLSARSSIMGGKQQADVQQTRLDVCDLRVDYGDGRGIHDISFSLQPGQTLGIVGSIGSGKSTLAKALLRLVAVDGGSLQVGGVDVSALDVQSVRALFAYVPQDATLLSKSIADNVAFGRPDATRAQVHAALALANLDDDISSWPEGIETLVGERGVTLSGGQKQRCALARALLRQAPILLLDDSLSAVDSTTEVQILQSLARRAQAQSTIIIAHRTATVEHADEILLLEGGRVAERGSHAALMQQNGAYAEMVRRQKMGLPQVRRPSAEAAPV